MRSVRSNLLSPRSIAVALLAAGLATACGPRVEYRARPGYASSEELPDEIVLEDGTIIRYVPLSEFLARRKAREQGRDYEPPSTDAAAADPQKPGFRAWEEAEDGSIRMQAIMPEQVVANAMRAFREERYGDLWDQMVADGVRRRAALEGGPEVARERFISWCGKNRSDAMTLLNRMSFAFSSNGVVMRKTGDNMLQMTLTPQVIKDFKLRVVEVSFETTPEGERVKLAGIR
ncbi:MAG: hypothetical protein RLY21_275 [Planctomycetota bacterium]|jgi:hypothetical protein